MLVGLGHYLFEVGQVHAGGVTDQLLNKMEERHRLVV